MILAVRARPVAPGGPAPAARPRAGLPRRRGGRRRAAARTGWSTTTATCSRGSPRRSARSAASASTVGGRRASTCSQTAEKGIAWLRLIARGRAGHGSHDQRRQRGHPRWPRPWRGSARTGGRVRSRRRSGAFLDGCRGAVRHRRSTPTTRTPWSATLGTAARFVGATLRNTANPTMLEAGYKHNVIPGDARRRWSTAASCPGTRRSSLATVTRAGGRRRATSRCVQHDIALETPFDGRRRRCDERRAAGRGPGARASCRTACPAAPTTRRFARLGIRGYGFAPLRLPADLDFAAMFHGVDERVPVEALQFGTRVLDRFLETC